MLSPISTPLSPASAPRPIRPGTISNPQRFGKLDDDDFELPKKKKDPLGLKARAKGAAITIGGLIGLGATGGLLGALNLYLLPMVATGVTLYGIRKIIKGK